MTLNRFHSISSAARLPTWIKYKCFLHIPCDFLKENLIFLTKHFVTLVSNPRLPGNVVWNNLQFHPMGTAVLFYRPDIQIIQMTTFLSHSISWNIHVVLAALISSFELFLFVFFIWIGKDDKKENHLTIFVQQLFILMYVRVGPSSLGPTKTLSVMIVFDFVF